MPTPTAELLCSPHTSAQGEAAPKPPAPLGKPPRAPRPQAAQGSTPQHRSRPELSHLRQELHELQHRLAALPAQAPVAAKEQLIGKLGGRERTSSDSSEEHAPIPPKQQAAGPQLQLKLSKLRRTRSQRAPAAGTGAEQQATQPEPVQQQQQQQQQPGSQHRSILSRLERAVCSPRLLQEATARLLPKRPGAELGNAGGPAQPATVVRQPTHTPSNKQAAERPPTPPVSRLPPPTVPLQPSATPAVPQSASWQSTVVARGHRDLPADLLSLRESATLQQRGRQVPSAGAQGQGSVQPETVTDVLRQESSLEEGPHMELTATSHLIAAPVSDATKRLAAVRRKRHPPASNSDTLAQRPAWDTQGGACDNNAAADSAILPPVQVNALAAPQDTGAAQTAAVHSPGPTPAAARAEAKLKAVSQGTPAKSGRPTPAMLRQQQAWGSLAGTTLEEMLRLRKPAAPSKAEAQEDQENMPSPQANSRRAGSPNAAALQQSPSTQHPLSPSSKLAAGPPRRRTEPAIRATPDAESSLQRLQRLHSDGHAHQDTGAIQWGLPPGSHQHEAGASAAAASIPNQASGILGSEHSGLSTASGGEPRPESEVLAGLHQGPISEPGSALEPLPAAARQRRGTWNFRATEQLPAVVTPGGAAAAQQAGHHYLGRHLGAAEGQPASHYGRHSSVAMSQQPHPQRRFSTADVPPPDLPANAIIHHQVHSDGTFSGVSQRQLQRAPSDLRGHATGASTALPALQGHHGWQQGLGHQQWQSHTEGGLPPVGGGHYLHALGSHAGAMQKQAVIAPHSQPPAAQHHGNGGSLPPLSRHHMF